MSKNSKWNYESCYEEAKKYKSRNEFKHGSSGAYTIAVRNKWLDNYTWLTSNRKPNDYWTYERCYEEAKKCKSSRELRRKSQSAHTIACKNGWLKDYVWFEKPFRWTYEDCLEIAKKCKSRKDFEKSNNSAYQVALKNKWLDDYIWFSKSLTSKKWTYESCYEEAKKYKSKNEFRRCSSGAYNVALKNSWICDYTWFNVLWEKKWDKESCYEEAKKYKSRNEFQRCSGGAYDSARKNNWLDDYTWLTRPTLKWTYESCYEEAKKYKSINELRNCNETVYSVSLQNGWLKDFNWLEYVKIPREYRFNLLEEFISEYEFRTFLENNDQNILLIIIRNLEPKYEPIKKDLEKALARTKETDQIKALRDKYMSDDEEQDANDEVENTGKENVHDINTIDMDDDEAFKAVMTEITESNEESEKEDGEKEEKELSIDDVVKNDETELKVINKIEHMLTPEDRQYIMEKFLNDRRRQWMAEREKKSCNA